MVRRPLRAYIEGYQDGVAGVCLRPFGGTRRWQRAFEEGKRDGRTDRKHIEAGHFFLPGGRGRR